MSFQDLKKRSGTAAAIEKLNKEAEKLNTNKFEKDNRFWYPELDKASNGYGVIRFLPAAEGEDAPWVRVFSHGFQAKGGWYIENCPTTIGGKCPVCEANNELWNSGIEANKDLARARKRKLSYISNVLILSDPKNPENEGQVRLFRYGKKIWDKIMDKMHPPVEFQDETPTDIFDFWTGADFALKIRKFEGYINYDKSEFKSAAALAGGDDAKLETLWKKQHKLAPFVAADQFKSYDELRKALDQKLNGTTATASAASTSLPASKPSRPPAEETEEAPFQSMKKQSASPAPSAKSKAIETEPEEDDPLAYFEKLAEE